MKAYSGNEPFIFVSYDHDDRDIVYPIIELLQGNGYHVWYDEGLHIGNDWRDELAERIANCRAFIYMCSERSVKSGYCRDEIYAADNEMKRRLDADAEKDLDDCLQMVTVKLDEANLSGGIGLVLNSKQVLSGIGASAEEITKRLSGIEKLDTCRDQFCYVEGVNWGPARDGYYFDLRPDHAVFNSIVDNPIYGDERHFLGINGHSQNMEDHLVEVLPGTRYTVSIYYNNDAASITNTTGGGKGISMKTKVAVRLPGMLCAGKREIMQAEITSTTAEYQRVWDQIALHCPVDAIIEFVLVSAKLFNHGKLSGEVLGTLQNLKLKEGRCRITLSATESIQDSSERISQVLSSIRQESGKMFRPPASWYRKVFWSIRRRKRIRGKDMRTLWIRRSGCIRKRFVL